MLIIVITVVTTTSGKSWTLHHYVKGLESPTAVFSCQIVCFSHIEFFLNIQRQSFLRNSIFPLASIFTKRPVIFKLCTDNRYFRDPLGFRDKGNDQRRRKKRSQINRLIAAPDSAQFWFRAVPNCVQIDSEPSQIVLS